jgi:hypothetical protein
MYRLDLTEEKFVRIPRAISRLGTALSVQPV